MDNIARTYENIYRIQKYKSRNQIPIEEDNVTNLDREAALGRFSEKDEILSLLITPTLYLQNGVNIIVKL